MTHRVFVTGATGVLGRAAVPVLVAAGIRVTGVARSAVGADRLRAAGATPITVDLFDGDAVRAAVAGHDAIVHLATAIPPMTRMHRRAAWRTNDRLRVDATRALLDAARANGIDRVVKESVTFPYLDGGDAWLDESAPVDPAKAWRSTLAGERLVTGWTGSGGAGVVLRFGALYAADARSTDEVRRLARWGLAPVPGPSDAFVSAVHAADAATAIRAALDAPPAVYNVVDDRPLRRRELADAVARAFGTGRLRAVPAETMRWIGGDGARGLTASQRVDNRAFAAATGWAPQWVDAAAGWAAIGRQSVVAG
ncbi:MAG: NAD(P)-dependent oxidoreductase [Actinobacteria bacterium]|nr:NAD(P)-dependent oxidoreductase [Actinomycetota bacterium]